MENNMIAGSNFTAVEPISQLDRLSKCAELGRILLKAVAVEVTYDSEHPDSMSWINCTLKDGSVWSALRRRDFFGCGWELDGRTDFKKKSRRRSKE